MEDFFSSVCSFSLVEYPKTTQLSFCSTSRLRCCAADEPPREHHSIPVASLAQSRRVPVHSDRVDRPVAAPAGWKASLVAGPRPRSCRGSLPHLARGSRLLLAAWRPVASPGWLRSDSHADIP